uniref:Uncharacterized protein n=1 Tax=Cacopsylla melanoneura TaxID=428564 RepID=A0A8D8QK40_9HEMI
MYASIESISVICSPVFLCLFIFLYRIGLCTYYTTYLHISTYSYTSYLKSSIFFANFLVHLLLSCLLLPPLHYSSSLLLLFFLFGFFLFAVTMTHHLDVLVISFDFFNLFL